MIIKAQINPEYVKKMFITFNRLWRATRGMDQIQEDIGTIESIVNDILDCYSLLELIGVPDEDACPEWWAEINGGM